jgi:hypothetical protein
MVVNMTPTVARSKKKPFALVESVSVDDHHWAVSPEGVKFPSSLTPEPYTPPRELNKDVHSPKDGTCHPAGHTF